ncbi:MAG: class IV adenylate cyclase [Spirochaetales bacterium]|nr:class IV adenylate cyclase [Spirochaetales bacterium]
MQYEVELKAWLDDPGRIEKKVASAYPGKSEYRKEDVYYSIPDCCREAGLNPRLFRLRSDGHKHIVTGKMKELSDGMEINQEIEFEVSDPAAFQEFIDKLGFREEIKKVKKGRSYDAGKETIEVNEIEGLGSFIEIECIIESGSSGLQLEEEFDQARKRLFLHLDEFGIDQKNIEDRYYIDMLRDKRNQAE